MTELTVGKYTWQVADDGTVSCLRNGQPWIANYERGSKAIIELIHAAAEQMAAAAEQHPGEHHLNVEGAGASQVLCEEPPVEKPPRSPGHTITLPLLVPTDFATSLHLLYLNVEKAEDLGSYALDLDLESLCHQRDNSKELNIVTLKIAGRDILRVRVHKSA